MLFTTHNALLTHRDFYIHALVLVTTRKPSALSQPLTEFARLRGKRNLGVSWVYFAITNANSLGGENS